MIEYLLGVGLAATAFVGASHIVTKPTSQARIVGPNSFTIQFQHLVPRGSAHCFSCGALVTAATTSTLFSRDGESVEAVCKRAACMLAYAQDRKAQAEARAEITEAHA